MTHQVLLGGPEYRQSIVIPDRQLRWLNRFLHSFDILERRSSLLFLPVTMALAIAYTAPFWLGQLLFLSCFLLVILAIDIFIILALPRLRISFAATTSQLVILSVPRMALLAIFGGLTMLGGDWQWLVVTGMIFGTAAYIRGMLVEPSSLSFTRPSLVSSLSSVEMYKPLRILHLSDLHIERLSLRETAITRFVQEERPDFIFITGDFPSLSHVHDPLAHADLRTFLQDLTQQTTVVCSLGSPTVDDRSIVPDLLSSTNVILLRDQILRVPMPGGKTLSIAGMDCDHRQRLDSEVFKHLESLMHPQDLNVLLFHSPEIMPIVKNSLIDLYLCGHTHGGQIRLPFYGALITSSVTGKTYEKGMYRSGRTHLYVSSGVGLEGRIAPRMRLLCRPEAVLWTIEPTTSE